MSKKFKQLLSAFLAVAMISTSGVMALADEPAAKTDGTAAIAETASPEATAAAADASASPAADATATPEATAEATAAPTEAPTPEPTATPEPAGKYDNDAYYKKALALCQALGIITGYEDGSVKPESNVTRAEMAAIVLRTLNTKTQTNYRNLFTDVAAEHWAATTIQTAADASIINGMGDGTFNPDGNVLYEQAVKMLVCAKNYGEQAELQGGYPNGYIGVAANNLTMLKNASGAIGDAADRGLIIKLAYNALIGPYNELVTGDKGFLEYQSKQTLAKAKFDVTEAKGVLTATSTTSLTSTKPAKGQIILDNDTFVCELEGLESMLSQYVTYYFVDDGKADAKVIAVVPNDAKTTTVEIDAMDVEKISGVSTAAGTIRTYNNKTYKINNAYIVYNGDVIDSAIYSAAVEADEKRFAKRDYAGKELGETMSFDEFLKPKAGTLKLIDNDSDGKFDSIFVTAAENLVITAATEKKVTGKINGAPVTIDVDNESGDKTITVVKEGDTIKPKNLKKNDVAVFTRNLAGDVMSFEVTGESVTGQVSSIRQGNDEDMSKAKINGKDYFIDANAVADCTSGIEGTFYFDKYNRIGYVDAASVISSSDKYGWIVTSYMDESGDDYHLTIFSQDGKAETYTLAKNISFWGPSDTEASTIDKNTLQKNLPVITYNKVGSYEVRLVKYSANKNNEITKLYFTTFAKNGYTKDTVYDEDAKTYNKNALTMVGTNLTGYVSTGNMNGDYYMSDGMIEFVVPNTVEEMRNASNYTAGSAKAATYLNKENPVGKDFIIGEFSDNNQTYPTVVVRFQGSASNAALYTDYGTADNNPTMVVKEIMTGVNEDLETVYTIVGYTNGGEVSYTTKVNTLLTKATGDISAISAAKEYSVTDIWDAKDGMRANRKDPDGNQLYPDAETLTDIIGEGDIIGVKDGGRVLMMFVDASELAEGVKSGVVPAIYNDSNMFANSSATRDQIYIGRVANSDMGENAVMTIAGKKCLFDNARAMDTIIIKANGEAEVDSANISTIADVQDFDDATDTGDFAFIRYAAKGQVQEIVLYRFED